MKSLKITQSITNRQDPSLSIFLREINKIPMISPDKEIELAKRIKNGDTSAINKLVEANLRFVVSVAKQYQNKGLPLVDLIQSGTEGMLEAAKRWDDTRGFKFISYAVWWIRQAIIQSISTESRTVRLPTNQIATLSKIGKASEKIEQENIKLASVEELAKKTAISTDKISMALIAATRPLSLDTPFRDDDTNCLLDIIPNNSESTDTNTTNSYTLQILLNVLDKFPNRNNDIVKMFYGLQMDELTLEGIAIRFGLGTERVRQIIVSTIEEIQNRYSKELVGLL